MKYYQGQEPRWELTKKDKNENIRRQSDLFQGKKYVQSEVKKAKSLQSQKPVRLVEICNS